MSPDAPPETGSTHTNDRPNPPIYIDRPRVLLQIGGSLYVCLPKPACTRFGWHKGDILRATTTTAGSIIITKLADAS